MAYETRQRLTDLLVDRYPVLGPCRPKVLEAADVLIRCYTRGGRVLACGNGGSAADAGHIVGELVKGFKLERPVRPGAAARFRRADAEMGEVLATRLQEGLPAVDLGAHTALLTAFANDRDPALAYAQQVYVYGRPDDVVIGLSTSGNSRNVVYALAAARALGLSTLGMTGEGGGSMARWCDVLVAVPEQETARVQELHLPVYHTLCEIVEDHFYGAGAPDRTGRIADA